MKPRKISYSSFSSQTCSLQCRALTGGSRHRKTHTSSSLLCNDEDDDDHDDDDDDDHDDDDDPGSFVDPVKEKPL